MSEHSTPEERTEDPTDRRMSDLRKKGSVHMSQEVVLVITLMTGFLILQMSWQWLLESMKLVLVRSFQLIAAPEPLNVQNLYHGMLTVLLWVGPPVGVITLVVAAAAALAVMLQTKWNIKGQWIEWRFNLINPIAGFQRIFSVQGWMTTLKAIVKLCIILPMGYYALKGFAPQMINLIWLTVEDVLAFTGLAMVSLFWKVMYVLIALAIFDYFWTRHQWLRNYRMTKEEVKDERKAVEGDESTKRRIIAKGLQRIRQRILQSVPQADVVVTNPTHYAVALKYDRAVMQAPMVVAKGRGFLALRIREIARQSGVPVLERKSLARALYQSVEVGAQIPYELFKAVAEVLAYVYRLRRRTAPGANISG